MFTVIEGVEDPLEHDPALVEVVKVYVGQLTVLEVADVYEPELGLPEESALYCQYIVVP